MQVQIFIVNTLTSERNLVAEFATLPDARIAVNALQLTAPKHLLYEIVGKEKPILHTWLFEFKGGGWNSVVASTREEAIQAAYRMFGDSETGPDPKTFRYESKGDFETLCSMFN